MVLIWRGLNSTWAEAAADVWMFYNFGVAPHALNQLGQKNREMPRSVKESGNMFNVLRGTSFGTEHTCTLVLANRLGCKVMAALGVLILPTRIRHGRAMVAAGCPQKAQQWRIEDSVGGWQEELVSIAEATTRDTDIATATFMEPSRILEASDE